MQQSISSSVKGIAHSVIDSLPDQATMDDIMHALYVRAKFDHGEREIREGHGIEHEEAKQRFKKHVTRS